YLVVGAYLEDSPAAGIDNSPGSPTVDTNTSSNTGAAYVFKRDTGTGNWTQVAYLKASNPDPNDDFGYKVAITKDDSTIAISAPLEGSNSLVSINTDNAPNTAGSNNLASNRGAIYIFKRDINNLWYQDAYLKHRGASANYQLGSFGLAISGNT